MTISIHKRTKSSRFHGRGRGTCGTGNRKNKRNKGGKGMAGTGKRADHKKTLINNLYGNDYFGKQGVTSRGTKRDIRQRINLDTIELNLDKYGKKTAKGYEVKLEKYKILGNGKVKNKLFITCLEASESAIEKVTTAGGEIIVKEIKPINTPLVEHPKKKKA